MQIKAAASYSALGCAAIGLYCIFLDHINNFQWPIVLGKKLFPILLVWIFKAQNLFPDVRRTNSECPRRVLSTLLDLAFLCWPQTYTQPREWIFHNPLGSWNHLGEVSPVFCSAVCIPHCAPVEGTHYCAYIEVYEQLGMPVLLNQKSLCWDLFTRLEVFSVHGKSSM